MTSGHPLVRLSGTPRERGRAQAIAAAGLAPSVRAAMEARLADARELLARDDLLAHLGALRDLTAAHDAPAMDELAGLAEGYGLAADALFAALHLAVVADRAEAMRPASDGCTAWARGGACGPALLVKNRDYGGRWPLPSAVFLLRDPAWGGREILCVGSFGAPGVYSSGINSDGLALVDTQIASRDSGVGLLRYFVMTRVLACCGDVAQAIAMLRAVPHAGGGSLVLADRHGAIAAVELGHRAIAVDRGAGGWVARTNHFVSQELAGATRGGGAGDWGAANSRARLAAVQGALAGGVSRAGSGDARALMASHDAVGTSGLCRHGGAPDSLTLSAALYEVADRRLLLAGSPPCRSPWAEHALAGADPSAARALRGAP